MKKLIKKLLNLPSTTQEIDSKFSEVKKWELALEYSSIGLWEYDAELDSVFFSEGSKQIIGVEDHNFGKNPNDWNDRVHTEDKVKYFKDFQDHLSNGKSMYENEHRVLCEDGSYKWIRDRGKVVEWTSEGKHKRVIGTHTDITSRIEKEEQLEKYLQLITSQNKRLHNFTHIVSHNLKTHIGNFKNILEFYDESNSENEKEELMNHLKTISEALTTTIVDLDDIISIKSKSDTSELNEKINIFDCTGKIIESLEIESTSNDITLYNSVDKNDFLVANRSYLESVLYNLISNGIKYSHPLRKSKVVIQTLHTEETLKILISDNGIGIDIKKFKNQLFEMYQTFHGTDREDSRGVGLYITKTQVEAMGGTIDVDSELNEGTTFSLIFKKQKHSK
ncbi:PAS domain-containing sensor histidine kinase [Psychroserpens luteolus]|uniref:PAS domain-containing sensor histidine kinase n=1 Tax=Psychroserpens luteolus TaxID=2855840 RepID=UPI001E55E3F8|nr:PAS domain-containing sensor histidine kinase [Psychroserpens luteolus]MCD2259359.1 PAS domain-containing sensor histidine kinase [Psychroserpens luteolus]